MGSAATSPRKGKSKVRAMKDHKPRLHVDLEQAEVLLNEASGLSLKLFRAQDRFMDLIRWPAYHAAQVEGIDADLKALLDAVRDSMSDYLMRSAKQRDEAENLMTAALAALRILRAKRVNQPQEQTT